MAAVREYAEAGVDPRKIGRFKDLMKDVSRRTVCFSLKRKVEVGSNAHGAWWRYVGNCAHIFGATQEGLGNKNWIAEWMYQYAGTGRTYHEGIGWDTGLMAVNDLIASGAKPFAYLDEVAAGDSDWFNDSVRGRVLAESYFRLCEDVGMTLPAGESPALRYVVRAEPPVRSAPVLSGCAIGILAPLEQEIRGLVRPGDRIIGFASSGMHCNGASAVIRRAMQLPDKFLTKLPNGLTLGEEALTPTRSYVALVEALQQAGVPIKKFLPGTGDGVAKLAASKDPFTYVIEEWPEIPVLVECMREWGMTIRDSLTTFNCRVGYYGFVAPEHAENTISVSAQAGYPAWDLGYVKEGDRCVIFRPENDLVLPPQDE